MSGETAAERWTPIQRVESVLLSIISLLDDAECSSAANVDAGVMLRNDPFGYKQRVQMDVVLSKNDIPYGFVMPTHSSTAEKVEKQDDKDFWYDSDQEDNFGGSDTDEEMTQDEESNPEAESANEEDEATGDKDDE